MTAFVLILALGVGYFAISKSSKIQSTSTQAAIEPMPPLKAPDHSIVMWSDEALTPYLWTWMDDVTLTEEGLQATAAKRDPLRPFFLAFRLLHIYARTHDEKVAVAAKRALDFMLDEYEPAERSPKGYRWFYGFPYENLPTNWWSSMDALFGPLVLYAGWQQFGIERYRDEAIKSAKRSLVPPPEGGVLWRSPKGCWLSEYAWGSMTEAQEFHVLNGHLYGLQALAMLAALTNDPELQEGYRCARDGTIARRNEFMNADSSWTLYQTVPPTINPTHYLLFETAQFRALELVTGDPVWKHDTDVRARKFQEQYPLQLLKNAEDSYTVLFSMVGAPHPYWTDTYPVTVSCSIDGKEVAIKNGNHYKQSLPFHERFFISMNVEKIPQQCSVYVHPLPAGKTLAYTQTSFNVEKNSLYEDLPVHVEATYNATGPSDTGGKTHIDPSAGHTEGRLKIKLNRPVTKIDTIAIVIRSDIDHQLGMLLYDDNGKSATREYNDVKAGRDNIILLNRVGFNRGDKLSNNLSSLYLRVYTRSTDKPFDVTVKEVSILKHPSELREFFKQHQDAYFHQQ
ncbi:D-glucuronyl C5-epimerase family protein [Achromobacter xylosoxidans]|uniref:D-glucuronyl C5-epimerase family protein n=1 Tax=Alcaligenes xylosoxydans xylosoxydans TaxID=85698 RepID=UPI0013F4D064|nr:D-glucuronyl C5-epimerase family protein [Achromobacter xylosoxidans]